MYQVFYQCLFLHRIFLNYYIWNNNSHNLFDFESNNYINKDLQFDTDKKIF